ncbi:hypothetical protein WT98_02550 [Burkholderia territorii]|nr:hypothetical protein WT98_02550 [Burkholderia territorii]
MRAVEQQSAVEAAELLMEHGAKGSGLIAFRPQSVQAAAEAVGHLAKRLADLPGAVRDSLERGRNSAAMLSGDRLQGLSEMIQNADDAGARQVRVTLLADGLWLAHDGEPIQLEHVFGIAMPWITTKSDDPAATGRHGIGLMTLRSLSSSLQVHCAPYHVQLDESALSAISAAQTPSWLAEQGWTVLHVPLPRQTLDLDSLHAWIEGWGHAGLLFLRSVTQVSLYDSTGTSVRELRLKWIDEGSVAQTVASEDIIVDVHRAEDPEGHAYRVYKAAFASPTNIDRYGKAKADRTPVAIALPLYDSQDNWLHAGLPVVRTSMRVRVGAQFDTLSNRQGLVRTDWNQWLVVVIGQFWLASIANLVGAETALAWALIPLDEPEDEKGSSLVADLEHEIWSVAGQPLAELAQVPAGGRNVAVTQLAVEVPQLELVLREEEVAALAGCDHALPRELRDPDHTWWSVLAQWRRVSEAMLPPVDIEHALRLLDDDTFSINRRIELSAVAIDDHLDAALAAYPCIALADESIVVPPQVDAPELLVLSAGTLAEELGIGLHVHPRYQEEVPAAQTVLNWLRARKALMEDRGALALLKRIAQGDSSGRHIVKPLTESQLASLRDAFESISPDDQQLLGPAVGRVVRLAAFTYNEKKKEVAVVCSPAQAYLPRAIDRENDSFAVAAGKAPGLNWMSGKYATALRSSRGRAGLGAQRFLRMLGAELAPRVIRHSRLVDRYADSPKGLPAGAGPATRSAAMRAIYAEYTLEDWESPDLQRVVTDISAEKKHAQRRKRAAALVAALARAWDQRLADRSTVTAASTGYAWQTRGELRACWLWAAGSVEWIDDATGTKRRPCDLRLRTPASVAIYGTEGANYLRADLHTAARQQVLEALGVGGEASTTELVRHLRSLRTQAAGAMSEKWETEAAVVYQALAARFPGGRSAKDMHSQTLLREFSDLPGLILSKRGWRRPGEVLLGPPSFGNYRDYVPAILHTESLWRALEIRDATIEDCLDVMKEVALRRKTLEGEEVAVVVATLRMMQERLRAGKANATPPGRMRKVPLWTSQGWVRDRPVYAVSDMAIAHALATHIPVWLPGCEVSNVSACLEPLGLKLITPGDSHVVTPEDAKPDDAATAIFERAVSHLHEDLSRNDPQVAVALSIQWESLKCFKVLRHPSLHVRLTGVAGWNESELISVRAKADIERSALHVRDGFELRRVESGGRAIAALFKADPRKVAYAWLAACDKAQEGIAADEIVAAEEAQKLDEEKVAQSVLERARQLQTETANRKATKSGKSPRVNVPPPTPQPPAPVPALKPRVLVDPDRLRLKQPHGEIQEKTQPPPSPERRPSMPLPEPRSSNSAPADRKSLPTFSGKTKETLGLELARRALRYEEGELRDLRAQMGLGADAVDDEGRFFELKVYLHDEPNSIQMTDSEVKRAASTPKFYLVIVSQLEGEHSQPRVRVIMDPLKQLGVAGNGGITLTNVKHAASLVFNYEHEVNVEAASKKESNEGSA